MSTQAVLVEPSVKRVIIVSFTSITKDFATSQLLHTIFTGKGISEDSGVYHYRDFDKIPPVTNPEETILIFTGHHGDPRHCSSPKFEGDGWEGSYNPLEVFEKMKTQLKKWPHRTLFHNCYSAGLRDDMKRGLCYKLLSYLTDSNVLAYCYLDKAPRFQDTRNKDAFTKTLRGVVIFRWTNGNVLYLHRETMTIGNVIDDLYNHTEYPEDSFNIVVNVTSLAKPLAKMPPLKQSAAYKRHLGKKRGQKKPK
jgi:hypothetical protein